MSYRIEDSWLNGLEYESKIEKMIEDYVARYREYIAELPLDLKRQECLSGLNRIMRSSLRSCEYTDISIRIGDVCYIDYGLAYINESGYQHFGLVIAITNHKILVIPMSSKPDLIMKAFNSVYSPDLGSKTYYRKRHLFYLGKPEGLFRESVLFLNDIKYLNSARVIAVKAHVEPESDLFKSIMVSLRKLIKIEMW